MSLGISHDNGDRVDVTYAGRPLLSYRYNNRQPKSYFHPVRTKSGQLLTLDSPFDHYWHHGIFFTWKFINGRNFWEENVDDAERGRMTTVGTPRASLAGDRLSISQQLEWHYVDGTRIMEEDRNIDVVDVPGRNEYWIVYETRFRALNELLFDRVSPSAFDWGGYAGLSYRPVRSMMNPSVTNAEGRSDVAAAHGNGSSWCDYAGALDGGAALSGGVCMYQHPDNIRYPEPFYVFDKGPLQFLQSAFLFREPYKMKTGETLRLRYGMLIHDGLLDYEELQRYEMTYRTLV